MSPGREGRRSTSEPESMGQWLRSWRSRSLRGSRRRLRRHTTLWHHRHAGAGARGLVHALIHDLDILKQLVDRFLTPHLNILFGWASRALTHAIHGVFLHPDADLLGQLGAGSEFRHTSADQAPLGQVALANAYQVLVRRIVRRDRRWLDCMLLSLRRLLLPFAQLFVEVIRVFFGGRGLFLGARANRTEQHPHTEGEPPPRG